MAGVFGDVGTFGKYLERYGLTPKQETPEAKMTAAEIIAGAEETLRLLREKAEKK